VYTHVKCKQNFWRLFSVSKSVSSVNMELHNGHLSPLTLIDSLYWTV